MKIMYIFPHPDDESFGPAPAINKQRRMGHEVSLLTLTRGGATKMRHKLGYSVEQMGEVRYNEMLKVAEVLGLSELTVLNMPDSRLKEFDPFIMEAAITGHILRVQPRVLVTYAVHGISGFHDHLVSHALVKRVFVELQMGGANFLKRLAFFTMSEEQTKSSPWKLSFSKDEDIDCIIQSEPEDLEAFRKALACYETYADVIAESGILEADLRQVCFEIFQENHKPPLDDLFAGL